MRVGASKLGRARNLLYTVIGCAAGGTFTATVLRRTHMLPAGLGTVLEVLISFPCQHILLPLLIARYDWAGAGVVIVTSVVFWAVLGGIIGHWLYRRSIGNASAAQRSEVRIRRTLFIISIITTALLFVSFFASFAASLIGGAMYAPGLAEISSSSGLRFPRSVHLYFSGFYYEFWCIESYAVVTIDRADADEFVRNVRDKEKVSRDDRMMSSDGLESRWWHPDGPRKFTAVDANTTQLLIDLDDPKVAVVYIRRRIDAFGGH